MKRGFACGVFDLFHAGHALMLKECKSHCDYLVVAVNKAENINPEINPGKRSPIYSIEDRILIMNSCKFVDEVLVYSSEEELVDIMRSGNFQVRFLGEDYKGKQITDENAIPELVYTDRSHGKSTSLFRSKLEARS